MTHGPAPDTTMTVADAHGRARPSPLALAAANEIANQFNVGFCSDAMVLDFADIIDKQLVKIVQHLRGIEKVAGNQPDGNLDTRTGPNDAAMRGLWVIGARQFAQSALRELGQKTENFNAQD